MQKSAAGLKCIAKSSHGQSVVRNMCGFEVFDEVHSVVSMLLPSPLLWLSIFFAITSRL